MIIRIKLYQFPPKWPAEFLRKNKQVNDLSIIKEIKYVDFFTSVINFLIMAFVLFLLLKIFNKISAIGKKKKVEEEEKKKDEQIILLEEIRDLLKSNAK